MTSEVERIARELTMPIGDFLTPAKIETEAANLLRRQAEEITALRLDAIGYQQVGVHYREGTAFSVTLKHGTKLYAKAE